MQISHQLIPKLKSLRLSGILETLDVRNRQAIEEKLSHVEFLQRLLEDEVERRAQKQLRLRRASFDRDKTPIAPPRRLLEGHVLRDRT